MTRDENGVVLCVGEPLIALAPEPGDLLSDTERVLVSEGGAELNVAVHLARLGLRVRFAGRVGDDPLGRRVHAVLRREGVDASGLTFDPTRPTGVYFKQYASAATSFHYYRDGSAASALGDLPDAASAGVRHVHLTGILPALSHSCRRLTERLMSERRHATRSFDVNYRAPLWNPEAAAPVLRDLADQADIAFVGLDEARALWGTETPDNVRRLLPNVAELVVKDGERPALALLNGGARVSEPPVARKVVDPVGAGDGFAAGYLAARLTGMDVRSALRLGHTIAAGVLGAHGDHGDPTTEHQIAAALNNPGRVRPPHRCCHQRREVHG
jgi:2-dehydro-3-deoxygluconokinase